MAITGLLKEVVENKASRMMNDPKWVEYGRNLSKELGCDNVQAFQAGAFDGMIFDMAATLNPRRIPSHDERRELIMRILKL